MPLTRSVVVAMCCSRGAARLDLSLPGISIGGGTMAVCVNLPQGAKMP